MHQDSRFLILHLSLINGIGPSTIKSLIERKPLNFNLNYIYQLSISELINLFRLSEIQAKKIVEGLSKKNIFDEEISLIEKYKINWSTFIDSDYPELLKNIHSPPAVIYWQGKLSSDEKLISIIGSRKANDYSKRTIENFVAALIESNWTIVSGGAIGADTMAHEAALKFGGKTISILGSGLLRLYPYSNKKLFQKIIENEGAIVSSFALNCDSYPENFPARNRIISGISKGCIVVQAGIKSGTRITALYALEQGREVFAVPGSIDDELSAGCNKLIQEGAKLTTCANDILEEFGETILKDNNLEITNEPNEGISLEDKIIHYCKEPCSIEELSEKFDITLYELQLKLFQLQLDGKIIQNFAGMWQQNSL